MRSAASTGASVMTTLSAGDALQVIGGPTSGEGYTWYQVAGPVRQGGPVDAMQVGGWIAASGNGAALGDDTAAVVVGYPSFFGGIPDLAALAELAHDSGALLIATVSEPYALSVVEAPGAGPTITGDAVLLEVVDGAEALGQAARVGRHSERRGQVSAIKHTYMHHGITNVDGQ